MVTIDLLDDEGSDDDDVVVVDRSETTATTAAADIVDLTSTNTDAAAGAVSSRRRSRHNNNNNNEIQFIGSINSNNNNNNGVQFVCGNQNHYRSQLDSYRQLQLQRQRQQQSKSQSLHTGNRNYPEVAAAVAVAATVVTPARRFPADTTESAIRLAAADFVSGVGGGNLMMNHLEAFGSGRQHDITPLPSSSQRNKRKRSSSKKKPPPPPPPPPPMEKGKSLIVPTGFDALDMYYPHLKAQERTTVLYQLLPKTQLTTSFTKKSAHDWRVQYEKTNSSKQTLWSMVSSFSDYIISNTTTDINDGKSKTTTVGEKGNRIDEDRKIPAKPKMTIKKKEKSSKGRCNDIISLIWNNSEDGGNVEEKKKPASTTVSSSAGGSSGGHSGAGDNDTGPLNSDVIDTLHTYFRAYVTRKRHKYILDNIKPIDVDDDNNGNGDSAITCSICSDDFDLSNTVPCSSEKTIHFLCKSCFESYVTVTVESGPIHSICCPIPDCKSLFSVADAKSNLSSWDLLMIEYRETNRDRRVALAAKAVLHCECGAVGIITENDIGNGRIICPNNPHNGCNKIYCCKCGNDDHGTDLCPPPVETVQWLNKNSKECPNCKNRIEKNGGCDHMTCQVSAGGCGHQFWWTCGCPFTGQHKSDCLRLGER
jgi:hypothetical protein